MIYKIKECSFISFRNIFNGLPFFERPSIFQFRPIDWKGVCPPTMFLHFIPEHFQWTTVLRTSVHFPNIQGILGYNVFVYDYETMKKKTAVYKEELIAKAFRRNKMD